MDEFTNTRVAQAPEVGLVSAKRDLSYAEQIAYDLKQTEQRVADLKRIQEIFAKNPEFEELLTLVQRRRY